MRPQLDGCAGFRQGQIVQIMLLTPLRQPHAFIRVAEVGLLLQESVSLFDAAAQSNHSVRGNPSLADGAADACR